ncbi:DNA repair protein rad2 [Ceratobasidium sp. 414]|nr:DNA repair protein rad2 [Ceratobasidium sp. 414]
MGVKQLWTLLAPVGRPVPLETLEGKILAIDSSIWLYQFQATMRDKDGCALVNAHILGFLRRISKLLFYGIKPVFVFDGGAPVLKKNTIAERKKRKSGAAASHAKVAEKLLAAQLRREALRHTEEQRRGSGVITPAKAKPLVNTSADDDNYLEDLSGPLLVLPGKHNAPPPKVPPPKPSTSSATENPTSSISPSKKKNFHEHDPYRLPELETPLTERVMANDPRLATDEELRAYVSHLRPDDPEFHDLPADVQYEILGELRLKSRTTSHRRLQKMLRQSKTPMDFSMAQIKNLGQRNRLTQEVLTTLDIVGTGKGGVVVPVKIASEKNREYVLVRNEGVDGGFTLGMRSEGNTAEQPIVVEEDDDREGDDSFDSKGGDVWEDAVVPGRSQIGVAPDQDWRDYKRENALSGLAKRDTRKHLAPLTTKSKPARLDKGKGKEVDVTQDQDSDSDSDVDDAQFQLAMQASLAENGVAQDEDEDVQRALALSLADRPERETTSGASGSGSGLFGGAPSGIFGTPTGIFGESTGIFGAPIGLLSGGGGGDDTRDASSSPPQVVDAASGSDEDEDEMEMEEVVVDVPIPQVPEDVKWEDAEAQTVHITSTPPRPTPSSPATSTSSTTKPKSKPAPRRPSIEEPTSRRTSATRRELAQALSSSGEDDEEPIQLPSRLMTILAPYQTASGPGGSPTKKSNTGLPVKTHAVGSPVTKDRVDPGRGTPGKDNLAQQAGPIEQIPGGGVAAPTKRVAFNKLPTSKPASKPSPTDMSDNFEAPSVAAPVDSLDNPGGEDPSSEPREVPSTTRTGDKAAAKALSMPSWFTSAPTISASIPPKRDVLAELTQYIPNAVAIEERRVDNSTEDKSTEHSADAAQDESGELIPLELSDEDDDDIPIAWSRSPTPSGARSPVMVPVHTEPDFDSTHSRESRAQAENEEHASFMSTLQGKPYESMRESLDAEIAALRKERAAALRDAEDVTAQMSAQIQVLLRLFGVPFVNAPMEAEAQCAFLAQRGLVEGAITDDSDVFLFGAGKVFRNMFNQSKTVECFFSADLERELGLDRETLIGLAYLLGSDYTEGLPGVGPVVAMEIMKEFPGKDGLTEFRTWWRKVQIGRDTEADLRTTFRKRFKKKFKTLHLTEEWPNPKVPQREAYLDPTVDPSEERFQWGLPDLDGLRQFLGEELLWDTSKVDETLLPIIRRMTQRSSASGANKQGTLTSFIDAPGATTSSGVTHAPRKRQAYASKRLQQVVAEYRARKAGEDLGEQDAQAEVDSETENPKKKKPRTKAKAKAKADDVVAETESQGSSAGTKTAGSKRKRAVGSSTRGKRGAGRSRGAGRGRGQGHRKASTRADDDDEEEFVSGGEDSDGQQAEMPVPKKPRLRPRMKVPSPAPQAVHDSEGEDGSSDEYVEG